MVEEFSKTLIKKPKTRMGFIDWLPKAGNDAQPPAPVPASVGEATPARRPIASDKDLSSAAKRASEAQAYAQKRADQIRRAKELREQRKNGAFDFLVQLSQAEHRDELRREANDFARENIRQNNAAGGADAAAPPWNSDPASEIPPTTPSRPKKRKSKKAMGLAKPSPMAKPRKPLSEAKRKPKVNDSAAEKAQLRKPVSRDPSRDLKQIGYHYLGPIAAGVCPHQDPSSRQLPALPPLLALLALPPSPPPLAIVCDMPHLVNQVPTRLSCAPRSKTRT